jgi:hypothetical protein
LNFGFQKKLSQSESCDVEMDDDDDDDDAIE